MTKNEFSEAVKLAKTNKDLTHVDNNHLYGCGLREFQPVYTSLEAVARLLQWQCQFLDGTWNEEECNEIGQIAKRKFLIVG